MEKEIQALLPEIYRDAAQPTLKKVGVALSHVIGLVTTPVGLGAKILEKNLGKYIEKLETKEKIIPIPPEIGVPIMEKLKYTRPEELIELYTELLAEASTEKGLEKAHPAYFEIITNLSVDEARIINYLSKQEDVLPFLELRSSIDNGVSYNVITRYFTNIPKDIKLIYPDNTQMYLNNLTRLGIISPAISGQMKNEEVYKPLLENEIVKAIEFELQRRKSEGGVEEKLICEKSYFSITSFAREFFRTCLPLA